MSDFLDRPTEHVDVSGNPDTAALVESFGRASFQARNLYGCSEVYRRMVRDDETVIFLGLAGAMVPAGMKKIVSDLMKNHLIDVLVSTGANLFHDFFEALGYHHYVGDAEAPDDELRQAKVDRIYDTYASDHDLTKVVRGISTKLESFEQRTYSSREFLEKLADTADRSDSILCTAAREGIPVFCPALCDSAIGMALTDYYGRTQGRSGLVVDQIRDNYEIIQIKQKAAATGAIYVGGGVPKNYIQQVTPMLDVMGEEVDGHRYFIQLTTDDPKFGGLSGCTASEAESWGKVVVGGASATAYVDATIGLPLMAAGVLADCGKGKTRGKRVFSWKGDQLTSFEIG